MIVVKSQKSLSWAHGVVGYHAPLALRFDWERCPVQFRMCPHMIVHISRAGTGVGTIV
jgi:hypothetical protein